MISEALLRRLFEDAATRVRAAQQSATNLTLPAEASKAPITTVTKSYYANSSILQALQPMSGSLANSYIQIIADFEDEQRVSWAGTAHEIRELLRKILEYLAPTEKVQAEPWFKQIANTSGPTQKQRVKYILLTRKKDSKQSKVTQDIAIIDDKVGELVRDVYGRASDAAHRSKDKAEAFKILRYFEAFAYDLLDLDP